MRLVMENVTLGQVFLRGLRFHPLCIIPQMLHTHIHLHEIFFNDFIKLNLKVEHGYLYVPH
jgi:hypothetical protein